MELIQALASLTDAEASNCLNRVVASYAATNPDLPVRSPEGSGEILKAVAQSTGYSFTPKTDEEISDRTKAVRLVLLELAESPELRARVEAALATERAVLVEPVTTALIMAGIAILLSTSVDISYSQERDESSQKKGKSRLKIEIHKGKTSDTILGKLFRIFGNGTA